MVRFADGPLVEVSTVVAAPPERVWELVSDIDLPARFQDEFVGATWVDGDGTTGIGASFVGRNRRGSREWETTSWIVAYLPEREFGWAVSDPENPGAVWTYHLEPLGAGTLLRYRRVLGPGASGLTRATEKHPDRQEEIIAHRDEEHRTNMRAVLDGIRRLAEGRNAD